ncbi:MAG: 4Fe-4S binding protein [Dermatophilaceae bacterium]
MTELPVRSRGVLALVPQLCTSCLICARECPCWCIRIDSHTQTVPAPQGGRERTEHVLDGFSVDYSVCMYCGICVDVCPADALHWSPEFAYAAASREELVHDRDRVAGWLSTVPPPAPLDPHAPDAGELGGAGSGGNSHPRRTR